VQARAEAAGLVLDDEAARRTLDQRAFDPGLLRAADAFTEDHLPVLLAGAVMVVVGVATLALRRGRRDGGQVPHGHHAAR